ncbi:MFS transporter [Nonomuraea africana]|uniref:MFS family permease n=1 Tax=Nonomuraea africana TaxID=46171 RepID=A0ABR9K8D4_9ACTN|nr:MFS transporter [Nonomuraea africana]MBE1558160.1 MFS family permease [Nonomuraea africana]
MLLSSLKHHNYRLWAGADLVSITGTWMQVLGVNWLILEATGSATSVGLSLVLQALPTLAFGLWGGALADRLPARPVVVAAQIAQGLLAVVLAVVALSGVTSVLPVYGVALAGGLVTALGNPALGRFGAEVVPPADLPNAMALGSVINSAGRILGMSLAGVLLPLTGTGGLFLINAVSFLAVIAAIAAMRSGEMHLLAKAPPGADGIREGLRYVLRTPWLLVLLALSLILGSLGRNYQVTMAAMAAGPLGAGATGYGLLSTVFAVGTVLGGIFAAGRPRLTMRLLLVTAFLASVAQALSGLVPGLWLFAALLLPIAAGAVVIDTTIGARAQLGSPDELRGRVISVLGLVSAAAGALGGPLLGWLSDAMGPQLALQIGGVSTTAATLLAALALARVTGVRILRARTA